MSPPSPEQTRGSRAGLARSQIRRMFFAIVIGALLVGLGPWGWTRLMAAGRIHTLDEAPASPVTLVLGAGVINGRPSPFLAARLDVATQLYTSGRTQVILVSGDNRVPGYDEPTVMRDYLIAHGVPADRVVADFAGRDTYDSCVRARRIFGVHDLLVVSQGYHLPRAVTTCRAVGLQVHGVGDWTMQQYEQTWQAGTLREVPASIKTVLDVLSRREPVLGPPESSVTDALS